MEADDDYDPTSKERLASILPQVAAIISMIGSYIVIREVLVDHRQRRGKAIPRILLEMCIADLIFSSGWFLATWPSPSDVENLWHNVGNIATCNFQGFLLQFGLTASPLFNIFLATFYLLMVRYNWTDARLQKLEWWVHGGVWIFSLACSIFPIFLGLYNNAWTVCWFESVPAGCKDSYRYGDEATCVRGDNAWIYAVAFTVFPVLICVFLSFVIMGMIYSFVRKTEKRMSRYAGSQSRLNAMTSKLSKQASSILSSSRHGKQSFRHFEPSMTPGTSVHHQPVPSPERRRRTNTIGISRTASLIITPEHPWILRDLSHQTSPCPLWVVTQITKWSLLVLKGPVYDAPEHPWNLQPLRSAVLGKVHHDLRLWPGKAFSTLSPSL